MSTSKSQEWARNLSKLLSISYESSILIEHNVTKGDSREHQILDILKNLLPKKYSFSSNVVINNSIGIETKRFDAVIYDGDNWPMLFDDNEIVVCPIESVKMVFEIKSDLVGSEIEKIFAEAENILSASSGSSTQPKVMGFAYKCSSIKLMFYDFVLKSMGAKNYPTLICILNVGLFCYLDYENNISKNPDSKCTPIFLRTNEDSLLLYTYLLTEQISDDSVTAIIRRYSQQIFESIEYFSFDKRITDKIIGGTDYRRKFEGKPDIDIQIVHDDILGSLV